MVRYVRKDLSIFIPRSFVRSKSFNAIFAPRIEMAKRQHLTNSFYTVLDPQIGCDADGKLSGEELFNRRATSLERFSPSIMREPNSSVTIAIIGQFAEIIFQRLGMGFKIIDNCQTTGALLEEPVR
jgi:hypothetical protein